ncbi:Uncharacterised protein [Mycobacteroides abscessus subsp. abscessus]|nr:Uncharacterised protein [Mycobacteroides abscessus subsp. abscessus]
MIATEVIPTVRDTEFATPYIGRPKRPRTTPRVASTPSATKTIDIRLHRLSKRPMCSSRVMRFCSEGRLVVW